MMKVLWRVIRIRCPFCHKPGESCVVCGGSGWVTTTEPDPA